MLNASKCRLGVSSLKFLSVVLSTNGIAPDPDKVPRHHGYAISDRRAGRAAPPGNAEPHRIFLAVPVHRHCANRARPKQGHGLDLGDWLSFSLRLTKEDGGIQHQRGLKEPRIFSNRFCRHQLVRPWYRPSAGATSGERRAVAFVSHSLTTAEQQYSKIKKEALGVLWAIQRFIKLHNLSSFVETDHQLLVRLLCSTDLDLMPRHVQWFRIQLLRYRFMVQYVPGKCLATSNLSSRDPEVLVPAAFSAYSVELFVSQVVTAHSKTKERRKIATACFPRFH